VVATVAGLAATVLGVAAGLLLWRPLDRAHQAGFAGQAGRSFTRNGAAFRPVGVNFYSAAGDPSIFECGPRHADPDTEIDEAFRRIQAETGTNVVRFLGVPELHRRRDGLARHRPGAPAGPRARADGDPGAGEPVGRLHPGRPARCRLVRQSFSRQPDGGYPLAYQEYVRQIVTR